MTDQSSPVSESERHAIAHAKYVCAHAGPSDPEVCFDYELIQTLLSLIERLRGHAPTPAEQMLDVACVLLWRWNNIAKNGDYGIKSAHPLKRHPLVDETDTFLDNNRTTSDTSTDCEGKRARQIEHGRKRPEQNSPDGYPPDSSIVQPERHDICPRCGGRGHEPVGAGTCSRCGGKGTVPRRDLDAERSPEALEWRRRRKIGIPQ